MTQEQKQEKKKPGLFKKIFKWIGLSILVLLIFLALVVEAPKKIVILLLIILAAFTTLPKPARKWFWLSVGALVLVLIIWVFLPEDNEGWRPYTFDEELAAMEAKYAIPDEENAATIYNELMESHTLKELQPDFLSRELNNMTLKEQWTSKEHPELGKWLQEQQDIMNKLLKASRKDKCQLKINAQPRVTDKLEINRYAVLRGGGCLLIRAGNNDMAEGRIDQALEKYICTLRIAKHLFQQQQISDFMVGFQLEDLALTQLNRFVIEGEPSTEQLESITKYINIIENKWSSQFRKGLEHDKLFWKNVFGSFYEVDDSEDIRINRNPAAIIRDLLFFRRKLPIHIKRNNSHKSYVILAWFFLPSTPQETGNIVNMIFERYCPMTQPDFDWNKVSKQPDLHFKMNFRHMTEVAIFSDNDTDRYYFSAYDRYMRHISLLRGLKLLIAIKKYKINHVDWPLNLDSIKSAAPTEAFIDPVTGNPLQYENHGERFSLYGETANIWPK